MTILGLPAPMFAVFAATVLAGSLGAVHYLVVHILMGKPFAEIPPPVMREEEEEGGETGRAGAPGARERPGRD